MQTKIITTTVRELNESAVFFQAKWKLNGSEIVAIHGRDKSTEEKYQKMPEGYVLLSVIEKKPGWLTGVQKMIGASPDETATISG
jgi:hypothetical protein